MNHDLKFKSINVSATELRCSHSLINGQCFHWKKIHLTDIRNSTCWIGLIDQFVYILKELENDTEYSVLNADNSSSINATNVLYNYLNISAKNNQPSNTKLLPDIDISVSTLLPEISLTSLYPQWCHKDVHMTKAAAKCPGVRVFNQDVFECLISFICSSNNNITRITGMLDTFRRTYGTKLTRFQNQDYHQFPTLEELISNPNFTIEALTKLGFGYRAKYVYNTVYKLKLLGGISYLKDLQLSAKFLNTSQVLAKLQQFEGVGPKVANCVALSSLQRYDAVPMDVHMIKIVKTHYNNDVLAFEKLFQQYAGWAQLILFTSQVFSTKPTSNKAFKLQKVKQPANKENAIKKRKYKELLDTLNDEQFQYLFGVSKK